MTTPTLDQLDEHTGRLLAAIELAQFELENGMYIEAKITLAMVMEEHKARLVRIYSTGSVDKRWMKNPWNRMTFIDPALNFPPLARTWESEQD